MANAFTDDAVLCNPYTPPTEAQTATQYPLDQAIEGCGPGRKERTQTFQKDGKLYTVTWRDAVVPEDWLISQMKAGFYSRRRVEAFRGTPPSRAFRAGLTGLDLEV